MHILHLYVLLREYSLLIEGDSILLELCILFHDLIYDPTSKSNEEDSAKLFMQFSTETTLPQESIEFVQRVILDTKNHTAATPLDADAALFLDLDLTILASEPHLYDEYAKQVREEYSHVTDEQFRAGRGAFLRKMLDVQHIFHTPYFRDALAPTARANMERELNKLSQHGQST
jgi:predicted metal-dependent HD superfamily phosphohydrolase